MNRHIVQTGRHTIRKQSKDAIAGLEALGRLLKQLPPTEMGYLCGLIHGMAEGRKAEAASGKHA